MSEHEQLKEDFRTLVRLHNSRKDREDEKDKKDGKDKEDGEEKKNGKDGERGDPDFCSVSGNLFHGLCVKHFKSLLFTSQFYTFLAQEVLDHISC